MYIFNWVIPVIKIKSILIFSDFDITVCRLWHNWRAKNVGGDGRYYECRHCYTRKVILLDTDEYSKVNIKWVTEGNFLDKK